MHTTAYFKKVQVIDTKDGDVVKVEMHIDKCSLTLEDQSSIFNLQGHMVDTSITLSAKDVDRETPQQKRNRKEREEYDRTMAEKHAAKLFDVPDALPGKSTWDKIIDGANHVKLIGSNQNPRKISEIDTTDRSVTLLDGLVIDVRTLNESYDALIIALDTGTQEAA